MSTTGFMFDRTIWRATPWNAAEAKSWLTSDEIAWVNFGDGAGPTARSVVASMNANLPMAPPLTMATGRIVWPAVNSSLAGAVSILAEANTRCVVFWSCPIAFIQSDERAFIMFVRALEHACTPTDHDRSMVPGWSTSAVVVVDQEAELPVEVEAVSLG